MNSVVVCVLEVWLKKVWKGEGEWKSGRQRWKEMKIYIYMSLSLHLPGFCRDTVEAAWGVNYSKQ